MSGTSPENVKTVRSDRRTPRALGGFLLAPVVGGALGINSFVRWATENPLGTVEFISNLGPTPPEPPVSHPVPEAPVAGDQPGPQTPDTAGTTAGSEAPVPE